MEEDEPPPVEQSSSLLHKRNVRLVLCEVAKFVDHVDAAQVSRPRPPLLREISKQEDNAPLHGLVHSAPVDV